MLIPLVATLGERAILLERESLIGRASDCALRPRARGLSRHHAKLVVAIASVAVIDLDSRNGTFVNGTRIETAELHEGDEIYFGPLAGYRFARLAPEDAGADQSRLDDVLAVLSPREREVAVLVADGLTNAAIAQRLSLRPRTVATHIEHIFGKLGLESRGELIRVCALAAARSTR
ncbi:MAG: LuxR C-terminal-related transcriptional regulator [Nannocystaceae bacterium]|nr:LuxR C-terminal-related transcriptional regulator [Nannocystaceae bacterium]